jgi:PleD family two-component response regulator
LAGIAAGADDFIVKPFDKEMLIARLAVAQCILGLQLQVSQMAELLPICSICKKVRDDQHYWHQVEAYIARHTDYEVHPSLLP